MVTVKTLNCIPRLLSCDMSHSISSKIVMYFGTSSQKSINILSHNTYILFLFLVIKWSNFKSQSIFIDRFGGSSEESSAWAG